MRARILTWSLVTLVAFGPSYVPTALAQTTPNRLDVDTLVANMSLVDKVGQLLMFGFPGADAAKAQPLLTDFRVGGIVLTTNVSSADAASHLTADLQANAAADGLLPLLISVNHEGGSVQPIQDGLTVFGSQRDLGQIQPLEVARSAACQRGAIMGRELAEIGINTDLAPDIDILDNLSNTVIGDRAFSGDPSVVAQLGAAFIEGLQDQGVLAVGKHFPGHGSTTTDSHYTLPVVFHDRGWLDSHELVPFRAAIQANVAAIMVAHLRFPMIDPEPRPSSLSPVFVTDILRTDLAYDGLVMTDDLGAMKAVTATYTPAQSAVMALAAGTDVLLSVGPVDDERQMAEAVIQAVGATIPPERLDASVRRVLVAKAQVGLLAGGATPLTPATRVCTSG